MVFFLHLSYLLHSFSPVVINNFNNFDYSLYTIKGDIVCLSLLVLFIPFSFILIGLFLLFSSFPNFLRFFLYKSIRFSLCVRVRPSLFLFLSLSLSLFLSACLFLSFSHSPSLYSFFFSFSSFYFSDN